MIASINIVKGSNNPVFFIQECQVSISTIWNSRPLILIIDIQSSET